LGPYDGKYGVKATTLEMLGQEFSKGSDLSLAFDYDDQVAYT
jgi:hypothetical protein